MKPIEHDRFLRGTRERRIPDRRRGVRGSFDVWRSWSVPSMAGMNGTRVVGRRADNAAPGCIDGPVTWR